MPYQLPLPNGDVAEFPDDMPVEQARQMVVDHIGKMYPQEEQVGAISQFLKMAGLGAAPAAAGLAAFGPSAALGAPLGPLGALATGLTGSTLAALGIGAGQAELLERNPELAASLGLDPETLARGARQNPTATTLGSLAPAVVGFRPGSPFAAPLAATAGAGIGAGAELGLQATTQEEPIDWSRVGLSALAGGIFRDPNALGRSLLIGKTAREMFGVTPRAVAPEVPPAVPPPPVEAVVPPTAEAAVAEAAAAEAAAQAAPTTPPAVSALEALAARRQRVMREGEITAAERERENYQNVFAAIKKSSGRFVALDAARTTGDNPSAIATLNRLKRDGLIRYDGDNWVLTDKGKEVEAGQFFQLQQRLAAQEGPTAPSPRVEEAAPAAAAEEMVPPAPAPRTPIEDARVLYEAITADPVYAKTPGLAKRLRSTIESLGGKPSKTGTIPVLTRELQSTIKLNEAAERVSARQAAPVEVPPAVAAAVAEPEVLPTPEAPIAAAPEVIPEAPIAAAVPEEVAPVPEAPIAAAVPEEVVPTPEARVAEELKISPEAVTEARQLLALVDEGKKLDLRKVREVAAKLGMSNVSKLPSATLLANIRRAVEGVPPPSVKKPGGAAPGETVLEVTPQARVGAAPVGLMTRESVAAEVAKDLPKWRNPPEVIVASSRNELIEQHNVPPDSVVDDAKGVYVGGRVYLIADQIADAADARTTLFHESLGHYGFRNKFYSRLGKVLDDVYRTNPIVKAAANKWVAEQMRTSAGRKYIADIKRDFGLNAVERISAEEAMIVKLSQSGYMKPPPGFAGLISRIKSVMRDFGRRVGWDIDYTNEDVTRMMRKAQEYVTKERAQKSRISVIDYAATPAQSRRLAVEEESEVRTLEEIESDLAANIVRDIDQQTDKSFSQYAKGVWKTLTAKGGVDTFVKNFQNIHVKAKKLQENLRRAGISNFLHDNIVATPQLANYKLMSVRPVLDEIDSLSAQYIAKKNIDKDAFLARMHMFAIGAGERAMREWLFLKNVPLSMAASQRRIEILSKLVDGEGVSGPETSKLRDELEALVAADIKKPIAERFVEGNPVKPTEEALDVDSALYNSAGPYTKEQLADLRSFYAKEYAENEEIRRIFEPENGLLKQIKDAIIRMNKEGNYHPPQLDGLIAFYRNPNYMPFKGGGVKYASDVEKSNYYGGTRVSGDLLSAEERRTGRSTDADNPYLRLIADLNRAAGREGITNVAAEVARLGAMGTTASRVGEPITFGERFRTGLDPYKGTKEEAANRFFLYKPDGTVEVWNIASPEIRDAVKGFVDEPQAWATWLSKLTAGVASMHTRWNPSFPVYNYTRDAITNGPLVGAKYGPKVAAQYTATVVSKVVDGGLVKGFKVARLLANNNLTEIKRLAKTDSFYAALDDYVTNGGMVTYRDAIDLQSIKDRLYDAVDVQRGKKKFATSVQTLMDGLDIWNDGFELTSRAAGYSVVKPQIVARMKAELGRELTADEMAKANFEATQFVRGLFNYSEVGKYGREMGALFMFSRSAVTGATRFWDALAPAFQNVDERLASVPREVFTGGAKDEAEVAQRIATYRKNFEQEQKYARLIGMGMMGMGMAMYNMALMASDNDSMGRNKVLMDNMDIWQRNARIPVGIEGMDYLNVPWGFGFGMFGAVGAQLASVTAGGQSIMDAASNMIPIAMDSAIPIPAPQYSPFDHPTAFFVNSVMPSVVRPLLEYALNVDAFGKEIYVNRMNQYSDPYTGGERLPEIYTATTSWLAELPGATGEVIISPKTLHFFVNSYLDGVGRIVSSGAGLGSVAAGSSELDLKQMVPIVSSFIGVNTSYDARQYQDTRRLVGEYKQRLQAFENRPEQLQAYLERNPNAQLIVDYYDKYSNRRLRDIQAAMNRVRESDQPQYAKRDQLESLGELRDIEMKNITDVVESWRN